MTNTPDPLRERLDRLQGTLLAQRLDMHHDQWYPAAANEAYEVARDAKEAAGDAITDAYALRATHEREVSDETTAYRAWLAAGSKGRKPKLRTPSEREAELNEACTRAAALVPIAVGAVARYKQLAASDEVQAFRRQALREELPGAIADARAALVAAQAAFQRYRNVTAMSANAAHDAGWLYKEGFYPGSYDKLPEKSADAIQGIDAALSMVASGRQVVSGTWFLASDDDLAAPHPCWMREDLAASGPRSDDFRRARHAELRMRADGVETTYYTDVADMSPEQARDALGRR